MLLLLPALLSLRNSQSLLPVPLCKLLLSFCLLLLLLPMSFLLLQQCSL